MTALEKALQALEAIAGYAASPKQTETIEELKSKVALIQVIAEETLKELQVAEEKAG